MRVLLVDASPVLYSVFNTVGHLSSSSGEPTGLRFGFLRNVKSYRALAEADKVVICWDTKGPAKKALEVGADNYYKADRMWTPEKERMYQQVPALKEMVELTCWTQVESEGYEADDLIGALTRKILSQPPHRVVIATSDRDMFQLLGSGVRILNLADKKKKLLDETDAQAHFGVPASAVLYLRAVVGDSSDNLPGIGVTGENVVKLTHLLAKSSNPELDANNFVLEVEADYALYLRNVHVMRLAEPPTMKIVKGRKDKPALHALFTRLEFKSQFKFLEEYVGESVGG